MYSEKTSQNEASFLIDEVRELIGQKNVARNEKLQEICELLHKNIRVFDWVGFYLSNPEAERELILGPFVGEPTEHTRIPFGKGICGQAADTHQTFVVQDVSEADNYLACSIHVKAEIVVPVMKSNTFVAELDVDSHTKNALTEDHRVMLEKICDIVVGVF